MLPCFFCFFLVSITLAQLHINDVCDSSFLPPLCYVWAGNPSPYNSVTGVLGNLMCQNGCSLLINPFSDQTCNSLISCAVSTQTTGTVAEYSLASIFITSPNTSIASLITLQSVASWANLRKAY